MIRIQAWNEFVSQKFYGPLAIWPWPKISPQSSLNVIYCLIITAWQWLMSFTRIPYIPMQIKPNKSLLRNRFLAHLLWEIGHLSSPSRSCLGRLIFISGGQEGPAGGPSPQPTCLHRKGRCNISSMKGSKIYLFNIELRSRRFCWIRLWINLSLSLSPSLSLQTQTYNSLYSAPAFLDNYRSDEILMEVLQDEKRKLKRNGESFYEYKSSFTMGFFRVSLTLLDNGKLFSILHSICCLQYC